MGPRVLKAKGTKQYAGKIVVYLADFLSAAISAAAPAASAYLVRYDSARVSMTVASQAKHLLPSHGIRVTPSGRFPSDLTRPTCSLVARKPALIRPCQVMSELLFLLLLLLLYQFIFSTSFSDAAMTSSGDVTSALFRQIILIVLSDYYYYYY